MPSLLCKLLSLCPIHITSHLGPSPKKNSPHHSCYIMHIFCKGLCILIGLKTFSIFPIQWFLEWYIYIDTHINHSSKIFKKHAGEVSENSRTNSKVMIYLWLH